MRDGCNRVIGDSSVTFLSRRRTRVTLASVGLVFILMSIVLVIAVSEEDSASPSFTSDKNESMSATNGYQITYSSARSTSGIAPSDPDDHLAGEMVKVLDNTGNLAKTGYALSWTWKGMEFDSGDTFTMPASDVILEPEWTAKDYTVTYHCPNETGTSINGTKKIVTFDAAYGDLSEPVREGYTFEGWYLEASYENLVTSSTIVKTDHDHKLYVKWNGNEHTVTYICPDETDTAVNGTKKTVTFGSEYGELSEAVRVGFASEWYLESTFKDQITSDSIVTLDSDHNLYAKWIPYIIIFGDDVISVSINGKEITSGTPVYMNDEIRITFPSTHKIEGVEHARPIGSMYTPDGYGDVIVLLEELSTGVVAIPSFDGEYASIGAGYDPTVHALDFEINDDMGLNILRNDETKLILDEGGITKSVGVIMRFIDAHRLEVDVYVDGSVPINMDKVVKAPYDPDNGTPHIYYVSETGELSEVEIIKVDDEHLFFRTSYCSIYEIQYTNESESIDNATVILGAVAILVIIIAFLMIYHIKKHKPSY